MRKTIAPIVSSIPPIRESWQRHVATCRHCGAIILWCTTEKGRKMPVDVEPIAASLVPEQGRFAIDGAAPLAYHDADVDPAFISHFCVCPGAVKNPPHFLQREHLRRYKANLSRMGLPSGITRRGKKGKTAERGAGQMCLPF